MAVIQPNTRSLPFVPPLHKEGVSEPRVFSKFPDSSEGIRLWSKLPLSLRDCLFARIEDPAICAGFEVDSEGWIDKHLEQVLRMRAVWNSRLVFRSNHADMFTREFWQNSPLQEAEFSKALSLYYEEEKAKHGAFGVGHHDIFPASHMTPSQQMSYIRLLARKNPSVLAAHIRSWVCSKEQIQEAISLLSKKSPHDLLLIGNSIEDVWSDGQKHPELVTFLQSEEKEAFARMIQKDPKILQYLKQHIERLEISLTQKDRDRYFLVAGMNNPSFFMAYKDVLSPSEPVEKNVYVYIFEKGCEGAVDLFQSLKAQFSLEDEHLYLELLMRSCPDQVLMRLDRSLTNGQLVKTFKNAVSKNCSFCITFNQVFLKFLTSKQRAEVIDIVYMKDPLQLEKISYEGLPPKEAEEYRELENLVAWRRFCIGVNYLVEDTPSLCIDALQKRCKEIAEMPSQIKKWFLEKLGYTNPDSDTD